MKPTYPRLLRDRDDYRRFYLDEDVKITLHNGHTFSIPKGYRFDGHSVPWLFRVFFAKDAGGNDLYASMVHDALIDLEMFLRYDREFQDYEYWRFMQMPEYKTNKFRSTWMPRAVRLWGWLKFDIWGDYRGEPKPDTKVTVTLEQDAV